MRQVRLFGAGFVYGIAVVGSGDGLLVERIATRSRLEDSGADDETSVGS